MAEVSAEEMMSPTERGKKAAQKRERGLPAMLLSFLLELESFGMCKNERKMGGWRSDMPRVIELLITGRMRRVWGGFEWEDIIKIAEVVSVYQTLLLVKLSCTVTSVSYDSCGSASRVLYRVMRHQCHMSSIQLGCPPTPGPSPVLTPNKRDVWTFQHSNMPIDSPRPLKTQEQVSSI